MENSAAKELEKIDPPEEATSSQQTSSQATPNEDSQQEGTEKTNSSSPSSSSSPSKASNLGIYPGDLIVLQWDYMSAGLRSSTGDVDLTVKKGDKCIVVALCPNDWIRVYFNNELGVIPKSYVKIVKPSTREFLEALWDYTSLNLKFSTGDRDLSFKKKEIMLFVENCPNEWMKGMKKKKKIKIPLQLNQLF